MNKSGTSGNDILIGTDSSDTLYGGFGNDSLDGAGGNDELYGGEGNDTYLIRSRWDQVYDTGGTDSGVVHVDFYKTDPSVENWTWAAGVQKLPYWIDALLPGAATGFPSLLGTGKTFQFAFPATPPAYLSGSDASGFKAFTAEQQTFVRQALAYISTVVDLHFVETTEVSTTNTIAFFNNIQSGSAGYAYFPFDSYLGSDVLLNYSGSSVSNLTPSDGSYAALTLIHEIGHALGLKHPFSDGENGEGPSLPTAEDKGQWSVMSYNNKPSDYALRYSPLDIAALQYLYGPSQADTDDDVHTLSATAPNFIWDGGGNDTIDASSLTQPLTLHLEPGYWSYVGSKASLISGAGQITINFGTQIESAKGGSGADVITANGAGNRIEGMAGNDTLAGGAGNDVLDGGAGDDIFSRLAGKDAVYGGTGYDKLMLDQASAEMQIIKLRGDAFIVSSSAGAEAGIYRNVEQIQFSDKTVSLSTVGTTNDLNTILSQIYVAAFRRAPETEGYNYWVQEVGLRGMDAVAEIIFSLDVVRQIYAADMSGAQFVTTIYGNVFNRAPDTEGLDYWTQQLAARSRGQLVIDMTHAALGVPDGTSGKDFFQNRLDWALYAVNYQQELGKALTPSHLITLTDGIGADTGQLVALIGQAESGLTI